MHDANKIILGATRSSHHTITNAKGTVAAGLAVSLDTNGDVNVAKSAGVRAGISMGRDLSDTNRTVYCRKGSEVPIQVTSAFTPTIGAQVNISDTTGKAIASGAGATAYNAVYRKYVAGGGIDEDGNAVDVALIDMVGGL